MRSKHTTGGLRPQLHQMGTETVPETSASFNLLTQLIARVDFINLVKNPRCQAPPFCRLIHPLLFPLLGFGRLYINNFIWAWIFSLFWTLCFGHVLIFQGSAVGYKYSEPPFDRTYCCIPQQSHKLLITMRGF
jgi:hypothetical protein